MPPVQWASKAPASFLNGSHCRILVHLLTLRHQLARLHCPCCARPEQQLLNISLITVPIHVVCICMSSYLLWPPVPLQEPPVVMHYSSFRKEVSTRLPVKPENIILSVSRSLKVSADLVKENTPKRALLSWNPLPAPNFLEANLREESLKRKCEPRGIKNP